MPELTVPSPYALLDRSEPVEEVLALTYTAQLGFFERGPLASARALGARVSVVADARAVHVDPLASGRAGARYLEGRVAMEGGVFHPKLLVLAGEAHATVALGSGNLTVPGWFGNAELWSVLRGSPVGAPATLASIADFLERLAGALRFSRGVPEALERTARQLRSHPITEPGPVLVDSIQGRIIDQLPRGPVEELHVTAPFYDHGLRGLAAVWERFAPKHLHVYLQPDTVVDGPELNHFLTARSGEWHEIEAPRYHHGKLIEWVSGDQRGALSGSPNISAPALGRSVAEGGNVEVGLLSQPQETLAPAARAEPRLVLSEHRPPAHEEREEPAVVLLGAVLTRDGLEVLLAKSLSDHAVVEVRAEGRWQEVGRIPLGKHLVTLPLEPRFAVAGVPVRVILPEGGRSSICFATDLAKVLLPSIRKVGRSETNSVDVFADPGLADLFLEDLGRLYEALARPRGPRPTPGGAGTGGDRQPRQLKRMTVDEYLERCAAGIGHAMTGFALGLPTLPGGPGPTSEPPSAEAGGTDDGEDRELPPGERRARAVRDQSLTTRRRYQRWCERLVATAEELPLIGRLATVRLLVAAAAAGVWSEREAWTGLVSAALETLGHVAAETELDERARGVTVIIGLLALETQIHRHSGTDPNRSAFDRAARSAGDLLADVDTAAADRQASEFLRHLGRTVYPGDAAALVRRLRFPPHRLERAAMAAREDYDLDVERDGDCLRVLNLKRMLRDPLLIALGCAEESGPTVALADTDAGRIVAAHAGETLLLVRYTPHGEWGEFYRLSPGVSLVHYRLAGELSLPRRTSEWLPGQDAPAEIYELLKFVRKAVGVDSRCRAEP